MIVYGGAGPLHASAIAREIGIGRVLVPFSPGHFSAYGMLFSDLRYDYVQSCFLKLDTARFDEIEAQYLVMERSGRESIAASSVKPRDIIVKRFADMRYVGQEHSVTVELPAELFHQEDRLAIKGAFDAVHLQRYGTSAPKESAELVSLRSTVSGLMSKPPRHVSALGPAIPSVEAALRNRPIYFGGTGFTDTPVYIRDLLVAGNRISGPALIEEHASTTVLQPGDAMIVDQFGNLDITIGAAE
jgi:N-methylhydantoinase A